MLSVRKFIGTREFYKRLLVLMIPILAQNAITHFTGLLDNVMVGRLGTEQMSGVSIINQLFFVFNLCVFGMVSGTGLFGAQSYGRGDHDGVRYSFRFGCYAALPILGIALTVFTVFGEPLISLYLHEGSETGSLTLTLAYAKEYLRIVVYGLIPYTVSQIYAGSLRSVGRTVAPMVSGVVGFFSNVILNYVLIFGALGIPALGVRGAAIATLIARILECSYLVLYTHLNHRAIPFIRGAFASFRIPRVLAGQMLIKGMPLLVNETIYALGHAMLLQSYSVRGLATVSAMNITATLYDAFNVLFISAGAAIAIVLGHILGSGDTEKAKAASGKLVAFALGAGLLCGAFIAACAPFFPSLYNTTDEVRTLAVAFILVRAAASPVLGYLNGCYFTVRSGGKTVTTFFFDSGFVFLVNVPLAYVLSRLTSLPIVTVFLIVNASEVLKAVIGTLLVARGSWAINLVESAPDAEVCDAALAP